MSRFKKFALISLVTGLLLLVAAVVLIPMFVDVNSFRPQLESTAREKLGRDVSLGELGLSVFPSIAVTVDGLKVDGLEGREPMVEASQVQVGAALMPLLSGQLEFSEIALVEPTIRVHRDPEGNWDVFEMLGTEPGKQGGGDGAISLATLRVESGRLLFEDAAVLPGKVVKHEVQDLDLVAEGLTAARKKIKVSASLPTMANATAEFDGLIGPAYSLTGTVVAKGLDLAVVAPYLAAKTPAFAKVAGLLDAELSVERQDDGEGEVDGVYDSEVSSSPAHSRGSPDWT